MAKIETQKESKKQLQDLLLETLSLYEAYSFERLLIEIDKSFVETHERLTIDDLHDALKTLKKEGRVSILKGGQSEKLYKRRFPKPSLKKRLIRWWEGLK